MLMAKRSSAKVFIMIGRLGRSFVRAPAARLLDLGKARGRSPVVPHCLKTFGGDSREVLGIPDAGFAAT